LGELVHGVEQRVVLDDLARLAAAEQVDDALVPLVEVVELVLALLRDTMKPLSIIACDTNFHLPFFCCAAACLCTPWDPDPQAFPCAAAEAFPHAEPLAATPSSRSRPRCCHRRRHRGTGGQLWRGAAMDCGDQLRRSSTGAESYSHLSFSLQFL
jgi:hypothetical protein